jgi:hypothetical protein
MADLITMLSAVAGQQGGEEVDGDFNQTVLLLHGDGTNGAQNNTFLDSSTNNFTITRNGNTTQGTFSPFSLAAGEWGNYFDGSGDILTVADNAALRPGTSNFTIEAWIYRTVASSADSICGKGQAGVGFQFKVQANNTVRFSNVATAIDTTATVPINEWVHLAAVREGTGTDQFKIYINGVSVRTATVSSNFNDTNILRIGADRTGTDLLDGYMSNFRYVVGTAVYTADFTPPTAPLTAITNTQLLTCQSNRFVDNSTNAFDITRNGDVRVTPFSPFAPTAAYDAGTNGGSGYFDGSGDNLTAPSSSALEPGSGDFTIEMWLYPLALPGTAQILVQRANSSGYANFSVSHRSTGSIEAYMSLSNTANIPVIINAGSCPVGSWSHIVFTKSNLTYTLYINGTQVGTGTAGSHPPTGLSTVTEFATSSFPINGYLAGVKIIKGSAVAPSGVPTAPPVDSSGTSLLLNFTNAGIFDNTGKNNLETVGNAQIDTTTKKYGTGSLEFDGTGDWLLMPNTPDQQLGTGNFTIEFWVYLATGDIGSARGLVAKGTSTTGLLVSLDSSQKVVFTYTTSTITSSGAITTNAWNHIAVVREGTGSNQTKIYIGGTNDGTGTVSTDFNQTSVMYVGANRTGGDPMKGFIDDLRITKGIARYTANFSVPGKAFPDQ